MNDLTGKIFDKLTVVGLSHKDKKYRTFWKCICECGKVVVRRGDGLGTNGVKSCGCYRLEMSKRLFTENNPRKTHGKSKTRIYKIYCKMKERCYNANYDEFHLYGGRGIVICDEWLDDFVAFYEWSLANGYKEKASIDRIEVNNGYNPANCRWVDKYTQANNKRNNVVFTHNGRTLTMAEWAKELNLPYSTLQNRYRKGKPIEEILNPVKKR